VPVIFTLVTTLFFSLNVAAKLSVTRGQMTCTEFGGGNNVACCQTETGKGGIEIRYCTACDNTNPPSNCLPRFQLGLSDPTSPKGGVDSGQSPLTPPKSYDGASSKGGGDVGQPLISTKGNSSVLLINP
jgi:hypothetical protein